MGRAPALILRLDDVLQYDEGLVAEFRTKEMPYTAHEVIHVQHHDVGTGEDALQKRLQAIRPWKGPLGRCDRYEEVRKGAQPYLPAEAVYLLIQ